MDYDTLASCPISGGQFTEFALTLIGTKARYPDIQIQELNQIVSDSQSIEVLYHYVYLGRAEAGWVLRNFPESVLAVARGALETAPEIVIPMLLQTAIGDNRGLNVGDHPLCFIRDWLCKREMNFEEAINRRKNLISLTQKWLLDGNDPYTGLRALGVALSPEFQNNDMHPLGREMEIYRGYIPPFVIEKLMGCWPDIVSTLRELQVPHWSPILELINDWTYIFDIDGNRPSQEVLMQEFARRMIQDFVPIVEGQLGTLYFLKKAASYLGIGSIVDLDRDFEILYPLLEVGGNWKESEKEQIERAKKLAEEWRQSDPRGVIQRLEFLELSAQNGNIGWPRHTPFVCREIANHAEDSNDWCRLAIEFNLSSDLIDAFKK